MICCLVLSICARRIQCRLDFFQISRLLTNNLGGRICSCDIVVSHGFGLFCFDPGERLSEGEKVYMTAGQ